MAISQTMSNPNEWIQYYQTNNFSNNTQSETPPPSSTTITTATASSASSRNLSPDQGRVAKPPIRRRSRTSRRTPTTLLNTDTTNFRAMVQQFTGAPTTQFAPRPQLHNGGGGGNFSFTQNIAPGGGFHVQYPNQQQENMLLMNSYMHGGRGDVSMLSSHAPPAGGSSSGNEIQNYHENYMI